MHVTHLSLTDFRSYPAVELALEPGVSALVGPNGQGKTNLVEAIGYVATLGSHRVSADAPLVRFGLVRIGAGENGGRVVRYTNVVLAETEVGRWQGGNGTITVPGRLMKQPGADRYAVLLREGAAGRIVAARYI